MRIRWGVLVGALMILAACTAQEKQFAHDLEDLPGITCVEDESDDLNQCGPDSLAEALEDDSGA